MGKDSLRGWPQPRRLKNRVINPYANESVTSYIVSLSSTSRIASMAGPA